MSLDWEATVASTSEATFITDPSGTIIAWNAGMEALVGDAAADVLGRACGEVVRGVDVAGNPACREGCTVRYLLDAGAVVRPFELLLRHASGAVRHVACSTLVIQRGGALAVMHQFRPVRPDVTASNGTDGPRPGGTGNGDAGSAGPEAGLTVREVEVLTHLAEGLTTRAVAQRLFISVDTVRTHRRRILSKCGAHTTREAIATARRAGLL